MSTDIALGFIGLGLAIATLNAAHEQTSPVSDGFRPGLWEVTRKMSGGPGGNRNRIAKICVTADELNRNPGTPFMKQLPRDISEKRAPPECSFSNLSMQGGTVTYQSQCTTPMGTVSPKWTGRYTPNSFAVGANIKILFMSV